MKKIKNNLKYIATYIVGIAILLMAISTMLKSNTIFEYVLDLIVIYFMLIMSIIVICKKDSKNKAHR